MSSALLFLIAFSLQDPKPEGRAAPAVQVERPQPEPPAPRAEVRDDFSRRVNEQGIVLTDWEGQIANPALSHMLILPPGLPLPADVVISSNSPMVIFDRNDMADRYGVARRLWATVEAVSIPFKMSVMPDRNADSETAELIVQVFDTSGNETLRDRIPIRVVDQDLAERPLEFDVQLDFSHDETGFFADPDSQRVALQAADDWAYFLADHQLDEVPVGDEQTYIWEKDGFVNAHIVTNESAYTGFLLYLTGIHHDEMRAGGAPSNIGKMQTSLGVELPLRRSGSVEVDTFGNWNRLGWFKTQRDEDWWVSASLREEPADLYSILIHEFGHALMFESSYPQYAKAHTEQLDDPELVEYLGSTIGADQSDHLTIGVDPISQMGTFGREYDAMMKARRWLITKTHLLCLKAGGYTLRPTTAFEPLAAVGGDFEFQVGVPAQAGPKASGGAPSYFWRVAEGRLPEGMSLDSFSGELSGTPTEAGEFELKLGVSDQAHEGEVLVEADLRIIESAEAAPAGS